MGLSELRSTLAASPTGTLDGHFKTVVKGHAVVDVDASVVGVVSNGPGSWLVMFEASGEEVAGGIAAGMSGSPLYVDDEGTDKLVGAVAYSGEFMLGATGLATPIEDMARLETLPEGSVTALDSPVLVGSKVIDRLLVTPEPGRYAGEAASGAFVAHPLATTSVGGLKPGTAAYRLLETALKAQRLSIGGFSGIGSGAIVDGGPVPLEPGASIAALATRGDMWVGGIGTQTYANGSNLLAFGHPVTSMGPTSLYLTSAYIDGLWESLASSSKMGYPVGEPRGEFTQDRSAGMLAIVGRNVAELPITSRATRLSASGAVIDATSTAVYMPRRLVNLPLGYAFYAPAAVTLPGSRLYDAGYAPGSAVTTTTIQVHDGTATRTVRIVNVVDDPADITAVVADDVSWTLAELMAVYDTGVYADKLDIRSVDLDTTFSPKRRLARITDIELPAGLGIGDNLVRVKLLPYGSATPVVVEKTLTVPVGAKLSGIISATCVNSAEEGSGSNLEEVLEDVSDTSGEPDLRTIEQIVTDLNEEPAFNDLLITLTDSNAESAPADTAAPTAETSVSTASYLTGSAAKSVAALTVKASKSTIPYGGSVVFSGDLAGAAAGATVKVYVTPAGETERLVATTTTAYTAESEVPGFSVPVPGLHKNATLRAVFEGNKTATFTQAVVSVKVKAKPSVTSSAKTIRKNRKVTLTAKVSPATTAGSKVVFEYYSKSRRAWRPLATKTLASGSRASARHVWKIKKKGRWHVRVRTIAGATNASGTSSSITIKVK